MESHGERANKRSAPTAVDHMWLIIIAIAGTCVAVFQSLLVLGFGAKESAMVSAPFSFVGPVLAEVLAIWAGYLFARSRARRRNASFACWTLAVLVVAEVALPISAVSETARAAWRRHLLGQIQVRNASIDSVSAGRSPRRFLLTYTLAFPREGAYTTFPAFIGPEHKRTFGDYLTSPHPEYLERGYRFAAGRGYTFAVLFAAESAHRLAGEPPTIDICNEASPMMTCRLIPIRVR